MGLQNMDMRMAGGEEEGSRNWRGAFWRTGAVEATSWHIYYFHLHVIDEEFG